MSRVLKPFALLLLIALFELPSLALPEPLRPTGELLLVLGAWRLSLGLALGQGRALRVLLGVVSGALAVVRLDRMVFLWFMGQEPLIYDQLFMFRHLFVLFGDIWSWSVAGVLLAVVLGAFVLVQTVRLLLRSAAGAFVLSDRKTAGLHTLLLLVFVVCGSVLPIGSSHAVRWMTPSLLENAGESRRIYHNVQQHIGRSPYRAYDRYTLLRKPDVYLILVESYGRVVTRHPSMRRAWTARVKSMERALAKKGWSMASGLSTAPVMGGRSWLAEGSVLMGAHVGYEAVFHHLTDQIARVPNFVSFLARQGYHTVLLAPSDRKRRGVEEVNYYRYQRCVRFGDLDYHGAQVGWGIVPDQYSLGYADEHVLTKTPRPLFVNFHMVSSHAPWQDVPTLVDDWRTLNQGPRDPFDDPVGNATFMRLRRYVHYERSFPSAGVLGYGIGQLYEATILYDLALLERYLAGLSQDALVIVMGDHQPPLIAAETRNFDTPVHVLARNPALLQELKQQGFRDGLWLSPNEATSVRHEGLFSLLVRTLVGAYCAPTQLPAYRPQGVPLGS